MMLNALRRFANYLNAQRQKGQILVFTAVLLPLVIAATGFTVDYGNMYLTKSKLQNAADAAAIAGGWAYCNNGNSKPVADAAATDSVKTNMSEVTKENQNYKVGTNQKGDVFYKAELKSQVPIYFLSYFSDIGDSTEIRADSTAKISKASGGSSSGNAPLFDALFKFSDGGFRSINANQNPDNMTVSQIKESSFYQGRVVAVGEDADSAKHYTHELLQPSVLKDFPENTVLSDIVYKKDENGNYVVDANGNRVLSDDYNKYCNAIEADPDGDLSAEMKSILAAAEGKSINDTSGNQINLSKYSTGEWQNYDYIYNNQGINPDLVIDGNLPAKKDAEGNDVPLYIIVDSSQMAKMTVRINMSDTSRPVVLVYTGTNTMYIEANNSTFRGAICAPNAYVHMNDQGLNFYGSVVGKGIEITGKGRYYQTGIGGSGGGTTTTTGGGTSYDVSLGGNDDDGAISWDS